MAKLEREEITIKGVTYVCRELDFDTMMGIMEAGDTEGVPLSKRLLAAAVEADGVPLEEGAIGSMGFGTTSKLINRVNALNGIGDDAGKS